MRVQIRSRLLLLTVTFFGAKVLAATSQDIQSLSASLESSPANRLRPTPTRYLEDQVPVRKPFAEDLLPENWRKGFRPVNQGLTAVAATEYMGTRAAAYAGGFNHHNHHHHHQQPRHQREYLSPGYQQLLTTTVPGYTATGIYTKHHPGRRVCTRQAPTSVSHHHRGRQIRLVYTEFPTGFSCCPGWTQVTRFSYGCNKPSCTLVCLNGGTCITPGKCSCPKQFTGKQCQIDVDECVTEKPCAQLCQNTYGGYKCSCRAGYQLQADEQSCRKNDSDGTAFEAHDLEGDYKPTISKTPIVPQDSDNEVGERDFDTDYEIILKRLSKLEKLVARSKRRDAGATEMSAKINLAVENIGEVKRSVESMRLMKQEVNDLRNRLTHFEQESRKVQHIANRLTDLESKFKIHCGSYKGSGRGIC